VDGVGLVELILGVQSRVVVVFGVLLTATIGLVAVIYVTVRAARRAENRTRATRATRMAMTQASHAQAAELAVAAERTRIAREMHDIVAHSLSVVIAQADGGRYAGTTNPEAALKALATISETGRAALADMRHILGVLRDPSGHEADPADLRAPIPDSQDLTGLVDQMRATGLNVSMVRIGAARALPAGMGVAIYRVAQEALTTVLKHGGPGVHVTVVDRWTDQAVTLEVSDDGRGAAAEETGGQGHGLIGMRERVEVFGGTLTAGPARGGGFRVTMVMPLTRTTTQDLPTVRTP
jgi:signal transduction histidine kinase